MTVKELIEKLGEFQPHYLVEINGEHDFIVEQTYDYSPVINLNSNYLGDLWREDEDD